MAELIAVYTPNPYRVVMEYSTESYWHFSNFAFDYIIPYHIFNDDTGIGYEGWNTWNPVYNASEPHVTCGPFILTDYEDWEFYEFSDNPLFHYSIPSRYDIPWDPILPHINSIEDISYEVGTLGNEIAWSTVGDYKQSYSIFMNGSERESGLWTNHLVTHNIDGLEIGNYVFTSNVYNTEGNSASSSVSVSVVDSVGSSTTGNGSTGTGALTPLSVLARSVASGSVVIILIAITTIIRTKRFPEAM